MTTLLADYENERRAFENLLLPSCQERILLFRGASGSGKTTLLKYCREHVPQATPHLPIELRGSAVSVEEIFQRSGRHLTWDRLHHFTEQVANMQGAPNVQIDRNWLAGINNRIIVALHAESLVDREHRRAVLTNTWFDDLATFDYPILVLFDTYEQATTEVQAWISGPFLARASQVDQVRVLVAGQIVPERNNIEWGHCCTIHDLYGVIEAKYWMPIVREMRRRIAVDDPESWLAGVCHALKGNPESIMKVIEGLPQETIS